MTLHFRSAATGAMRAPVTADIAIGCDGVNSTVRRHFYPADSLCFGGINSWRGVTRGKPSSPVAATCASARSSAATS